MEHRFNEDNLPPWFVRPALNEESQTELFPESLPVVLANLRISLDDFRRWSEKGWLPFPKETMLKSAQVDHLRFLRDLTRSGLGDAQIGLLMEELPTRSLIDPAEVAYSFTHGWVTPRYLRPSLEDIFDDELDELAVLEDWEALLDLRERIDARLPLDGIEGEEFEP
jgi:hypothetical protein